MNAKQKEQFLKWAKYLLKVDMDKFNLCSWYSLHGQPMTVLLNQVGPSLYETIPAGVKNIKLFLKCSGAAACAIGYLPLALPNMFGITGSWPFFRVTGRSGWFAIEDAFGINRKQANKIFTSDGYTTRVVPRMVHDRMIQF